MVLGLGFREGSWVYAWGLVIGVKEVLSGGACGDRKTKKDRDRDRQRERDSETAR